MDKQELIDYKNKLKERAEMFYDFASINENKIEESKELALSEEISAIADKLEELIYG